MAIGKRSVSCMDDTSMTAASAIVPAPRRAALHVAPCGLFVASDVVRCDLCAVPDVAASQPFELQLLLLLLAPLSALPTPMLQLLVQGVRTSDDARLFHSSFHSSPPPLCSNPPNAFLSIELNFPFDPHQRMRIYPKYITTKWSERKRPCASPTTQSGSAPPRL
jgi:hypothetical protein